jgi:hypothetical protein
MVQDKRTTRRLTVIIGVVDDPGELRCPACREIDWFRDGFTLHELPGGMIERQRVAPAKGGHTVWSCAQCAYEVPDPSLLLMRLNAAQATHIQ